MEGPDEAQAAADRQRYIDRQRELRERELRDREMIAKARRGHFEKDEVDE